MHGLDLKIVSIARIYVFCDGPQLFEARDKIGGEYIGLAIDDSEFEYLIVGVEPNRLQQFKSQTIDLLELIQGRASSISWQLGKVSALDENELELSDARFDPISEAFLPDQGYFWDAPPVYDALAIRAQQRGNLLVEVTLDPPEAVNHKINSETLGHFLVSFQRLLRHSYRTWARSKPQVNSSLASANFAVAGFRNGSVKIDIEPESESNLFGTHSALPALEVAMNLISVSRNPESIGQEILQYRGHFASAFINLLDVLVEHDTRLEVSWADALSSDANSVSLSRQEALVALQQLRAITELEGESRVVKGTLREADEINGTWKLESLEGLVSGKRGKTSPDLKGLVIGSEYQFLCTEKVKLSATGQDKVVLILSEIVSLD